MDSEFSTHLGNPRSVAHAWSFAQSRLLFRRGKQGCLVAHASNSLVGRAVVALDRLKSGKGSDSSDEGDGAPAQLNQTHEESGPHRLRHGPDC